MNNIPEYSVSEITNLTKNILEENFGLIKVRGEISKVKEFKGHYYFSLKDENYVLNSVCWSRNIDFLNLLSKSPSSSSFFFLNSNIFNKAPSP